MATYLRARVSPACSAPGLSRPGDPRSENSPPAPAGLPSPERLPDSPPRKPVEPPRPAPPPLTPIEGEPAWASFKHLTRYFGGLRALAKDGNAEYPHGDQHPQTVIESRPADPPQLPTPHADEAYPEYASSAYTSEFGSVEPCYLDDRDTIPVPRVLAYEGRVMGFPNNIMGSYEALGLNRNKCYDRYGRFGPYGYGYSTNEGGIGAGLDGLREGLYKSSSEPVNYTRVDWGDASKRCVEKNKHRFNLRPKTTENWRSFENKVEDHSESHRTSSSPPKLPRSAVMLRIWHEFEWTQETILHMRSMIAELTLLSGGEYQIFFLIHVKDNTIPIWSSDEVYQNTLNAALPQEFRGLGLLWSEKQMEMVYHGLNEWFVMDRSVYGVYRSAHFPLQYFAYTHPEFEFFWNWEMDIRNTGNWHELFESLRSFAKKQPRKGLWERNERYYFPDVHGNWEEFIESVRHVTENPPTQAWTRVGSSEAAAEPPVWGRKATVETPTFPEEPVPPHSYEKDNYEWGVGEEADLITLNPLFNPDKSGWIFFNDVTGYDLQNHPPARRTSIVTASRLSRRLLLMMHRETSEYRHTMFDEMWPATVALHHSLKAVYAPHPMYVERAWPPTQLKETLDSGSNGAAGSAIESPFNINHEHNFRGVTWYFHAGFAGRLWRRWWGFSVENEDGTQVGGFDAEVQGEGRMCLPTILLHPIKEFQLAVKPE